MSDYLFQYYPEKKLQEILQLYHTCTGLLVRLMDEEGTVLHHVGSAEPYCIEFMKHLPPNDSCQKQHLEAAGQAVRFGESYLFSCHAGLIHIAYPILNKKTMLGAIIAGPFLLEEPDASMILDLEKKYQIDTRSLLLLSEHSWQVKVIPPELAAEYQHLLRYLVNSLTSSSAALMDANQERLLQQSRINESIQQFKASGFRDSPKYPLELETQLITKIKTGALKEASSILNDLLGHLLLYEGHDVKKIRVRTIELCSLLSRAAIEHGSDVNMILEMNEKLISAIMKAPDIQGLTYTLYENMEIFTESLFYTSDKNSAIIRKAAEYIAAHFSEDVTLSEVAEQIPINPSYLSTMFKQVTGHSFKEHLNHVRIQEAQRLLLHSDYSILEISVACGFSEQSYFTKVFRKYTGLTPKQYR